MRSRPKQVSARLYASTAPSPGRRPGSKVRTGFEDAHRFSKVRILENPGDSFEDAHLFPRCARKLSIFETRRARSPVLVGSPDLSCTADVPDAYGALTNSF